MTPVTPLFNLFKGMCIRGLVGWRTRAGNLATHPPVAVEFAKMGVTGVTGVSVRYILVRAGLLGFVGCDRCDTCDTCDKPMFTGVSLRSTCDGTRDRPVSDP